MAPSTAKSSYFLAGKFSEILAQTCYSCFSQEKPSVIKSVFLFTHDFLDVIKIQMTIVNRHDNSWEV